MEHPTLTGRHETDGQRFPLWMERLLLVAALVVFLLYADNVASLVESGWIGMGLGYVVFPLILLALVETSGRILQSTLASKV
jgi:hypothetical protein